MKPCKYSKSDATLVDLGNKRIYKYPTPTNKFDISKMVVKGRHPEDLNRYIIDKACDFVIYIIKGKGKIYAGDEIFNVVVDDVVFVPCGNKFAADGNMEHITLDVPAFYMDQYQEISV